MMANNNYAKQLNSAWHKGFDDGLWSGEMLMIDICSVALYNCFGFGKTNPEKWDKLGAEIQRINDELMKNSGDEVSYGFEQLINALVKIYGDDKRKEIERKYRNLIYQRSGK